VKPHTLLIVPSVILLLGVCDAGEGMDRKADPATEKVRTNYSIGYEVGGDLKRQGVEVDSGMLMKGVEDAVSGHEPLLTRQQMREILVDLQKRVVKGQEEKVKQEAARNLAEGEAFLAENGKKEGVVTLPSGLQYKVIKDGSGRRPKAEDTVAVHYRGRLIDGSEFDSSLKRGEPAVFKADHVIPGWKEALPLMKEGSKWQLFVPSALGYGQRRDGRIGPNSTLIFEVELVSITK
jgi:FKBP-type peptidyl-prolyl cis-trans isomerase FklB